MSFELMNRVQIDEITGGRASAIARWLDAFDTFHRLSDEAAALSVGGALALACVVIAARVKRSWAFVAGSVLQVAPIACGVVVHTMFFIGVIFALLWFAALRVGDSAIRVADRFAASVRK